MTENEDAFMSHRSRSVGLVQGIDQQGAAEVGEFAVVATAEGRSIATRGGSASPRGTRGIRTEGRGGRRWKIWAGSMCW